MSAPKDNHSFAALERAAVRAHLASFEKAHVPQKTKARISTALNHCIEAARDLERFLGHAAADARERRLHRELYDAAKTVGDLAIALEAALASIDAFVETSGTARGAMHRAALEARIAIRGRSDAIVVTEVEDAMLRALSAYDAAAHDLLSTPSAFLQLVTEQRKTIARLHREVVRLAPPE